MCLASQIIMDLNFVYWKITVIKTVIKFCTPRNMQVYLQNLLGICK